MKLNKMNVNQLVKFAAIADSASMTAAARRIAMTRSALSHGLRALESDLGVPLFLRVGKRLVLTPEGALLRRTFRDVEERLVPTLEELRGSGHEVRGAVRVGLFLGFSRFRLADAV